MGTIEDFKFKVVELYLQRARYNQRVRATIPGAWVVTLDCGIEIPVAPEWACREKAIANAKEAGFEGALA